MRPLYNYSTPRTLQLGMQIRLEVPDRCQNVQTAKLDWPFYVILISRYTIYYLNKFSYVIGLNWHISQLSNLFISDAIWESFYGARNLAFFMRISIIHTEQILQ